MMTGAFTYDSPIVGGQFQKGIKWDTIRAGTPIKIVAEPSNPVDKNALAVYAEITPRVWARIGYIPKETAAVLGPHVNAGLIQLNPILTWVAGSRNVHMRYTMSERDPTDATHTSSPAVHA